MEHFPHNGTQQMNGLLPPIPGSEGLPSMPAFPEQDLAALNGISTLEPLSEEPTMGNVITSGFDSALQQQRRSNSGSGVRSPSFQVYTREPMHSC